MTTAFNVYQTYLALKAHFESDSYDYFKFNKKTGVKPSAFEKRKDKYRFAKLATRTDYEDFLLANFIVKPDLWSGDLLTDQANNNYLIWCKRIGSLGYLFQHDLQILDSHFNSQFIVTGNSHPPLLSHYLSGRISLETMVILDDLLHFTNHWDKQITETYIYPAISKKIRKYRPFLRYDKERFRKLSLDVITNQTINNM